MELSHLDVYPIPLKKFIEAIQLSKYRKASGTLSETLCQFSMAIRAFEIRILFNRFSIYAWFYLL